MKNLNLYMTREDVENIVGGDQWQPPMNLHELTFSLQKLNKKFLWIERRVVVEHPIKVWNDFRYESCGKQVELQGGGQLNLLKVTLVNGTRQKTIGEKTPFWQTVEEPDKKDLWLVWIGVPEDAKLQLTAATDWGLKRHENFDSAWADIKSRIRRYPVELTK